MKLWILFIMIPLFVGIGYLLPRFGDERKPATNKFDAVVLKASKNTVEVQPPKSLNAALPDGVTLDSLSEKEPFDRLDYFLRWIRAAEISEFADILDAIESVGGEFGSQARYLLTSRWSKEDPEGLFSYIISQSEDTQNWMAYSFFRTWAATDPEGAFVAASQMPEGQRQRSIQVIIHRIAEDQPQLALSMADAYPDFERNSRHVYGTIFQRWANRDLAGARAAALALENPRLRETALQGAVRDWIEDSPEQALKWIEAQPRNRTLQNVYQNAFSQLYKDQPNVAKAYLDGKESPVDRRALIERLHFGNLAQDASFEEIGETFDWIESVATGQLYDRKVGELIRSMADADQSRAIEFVHSMRGGSARLNAIGQLAGSLAEQSPESAFAFIDSLGFEDERRRALNGMSWKLAQGDIEAASSLILSYEDPIVENQLAGNLVREWAKVDRLQALLWTEKLSSERAQKQALRTVVGTWVQDDPEAAFAYVETLPESLDRASFYENAFTQWSREDPESAITWVERLPEGTAARKDGLYGAIARSYVQHDPMAASEWMSTLEGGQGRDNAVQALVSNISRTDPEAAFLWAETVGDKNTRIRALTQSVKQWMKEDPSSAKQAIEALEIEEEEKQKLRSEFK